jgi:hypothetical protein
VIATDSSIDDEGFLETNFRAGSVYLSKQFQLAPYLSEGAKSTIIFTRKYGEFSSNGLPFPREAVLYTIYEPGQYG